MLKCLLAPAALLYKAGVTFRHRLFDWGILKSEKFDIPVICIGNITVGGTGKTPMAEMVIAYMSQMHRVALLSRGYGRRTKGYLEVKADSHYRDVGDEPLQIKLKFPDTVVAVCEKRAEGIRRIRAEHPDVDLVVMDDGFQHRYVEPKVNIVMIDATRPVQHDRMLPLGTLRDLPEELHRAHYFVVTKCPEKMAPIDRRILRKVLIQVAYQRVYFTRFESFMPQPLFPDAAPGEPLVQGQQVIALSGIGSPKPFLAALRGKLRGGGRDDARRPSRLQGTRPEPPARIAGQVPRGGHRDHGKGCRKTDQPREDPRRDTARDILFTDKYFIHRGFGDGFSAKTGRRC